MSFCWPTLSYCSFQGHTCTPPTPPISAWYLLSYDLRFATASYRAVGDHSAQGLAFTYLCPCLSLQNPMLGYLVRWMMHNRTAQYPSRPSLCQRSRLRHFALRSILPGSLKTSTATSCSSRQCCYYFRTWSSRLRRDRPQSRFSLTKPQRWALSRNEIPDLASCTICAAALHLFCCNPTSFFSPTAARASRIQLMKRLEFKDALISPRAELVIELGRRLSAVNHLRGRGLHPATLPVYPENDIYFISSVSNPAYTDSDGLSLVELFALFGVIVFDTKSRWGSLKYSDTFGLEQSSSSPSRNVSSARHFRHSSVATVPLPPPHLRNLRYRSRTSLQFF